MVKLSIIVEKGEQGGYIAHCPELKGCWTQGDTLKELAKNIAEAVSGSLESRIEKSFRSGIKRRKEIIRGRPIPLTINL